MEKVTTGWHSPRVNQRVNVARWGHAGRPVLLFPTAGGDFEECERFLMMKVLAPLIDGGRIKIYSCDSISGQAWCDGDLTGAQRAQVQNAFDAYVYHELVPAIRRDSGREDVLVTGASIGAFNALAAITRHPDAFHTAVCMSGTYDLGRWMGGMHTADYHFSSPLHFLPSLGEGEQLSLLRRRFVLIPTGDGRWEAPWESWTVARLLGAKGVPNRVDVWKGFDHDWMTWRDMLPKYLDEMTR